jgi:hypothetical protein
MLIEQRTGALARELRRTAMVAQVSNGTVAYGSITPASDASDSDAVALALETARALEAQGDFREAARWLRRAADEAEQEGNDSRVVMLARAAADLAGASAPPSSQSSIQPPTPKPAPWSLVVPKRAGTSGPPPLPTAVSTVPPATSLTSAPPVAPRTSAPPPVSARLAAPPPPVSDVSRDAEKPATDVERIRVSVKQSVTDPNLFVVRRLDPGRPVPVGTREAFLAFTAGDK